MKYRIEALFNNRKTLYFILSIVLVSIFTLSIAYAAMSTVLEIHGNSEVVASSWDIHLENIKVNDGSVSANTPSISGNSSVGFNIELNKPGDFYEFTVDVVNDGSIDAMIDSVIKTPNLTEAQAKYIKYEITYQNEESISEKQTLKKGTSTPIKVRVEYRKDIVASDLPSSATEFSLKLTLVYVQSDGSGSDIVGNGKNLFFASGDINTVGSEVCIGKECFYLVKNNGENVILLSKYNLYVGGVYDGVWNAYDNATGLQDSSMLAYVKGQNVRNGTLTFSNTKYWNAIFNVYIYDFNSNLYSYVENYKQYLETFDVVISDARLISYDELLELGCDGNSKSCSNAPSWVYSTSYWTGSTYSNDYVWYIITDPYFGIAFYYSANSYGCRPIIEIPVSEF